VSIEPAAGHLVGDGSGLVLVYNQLESGAFRWPPIVDGVLRLTPVEFAALVDGIDYRRVQMLRAIPKPGVPAQNRRHDARRGGR